ncbi:hypothetical protein, partial [Enterococcus casseliflavus]|uniref:hypothetical protein n=1 Tax=Enterococcus casseliflavus TaxID=37734 RepID=UPI003D13D760
MTDDQSGSARRPVSPGDEAVSDSPLDELLRRDDDADIPSFPVGFRGYDREAVDDAMRILRERVRTA